MPHTSPWRSGPQRWRSFLPAALLGAASAATGSAHATDELPGYADELPGYSALYKVYHRDRAVGEAEFSVTLLDAGRSLYEFHSVSRVKGLYRLFVPRPVEEISRFALEDGQVRPLTYSLRGGTRRERNSFSVEFDWERGYATIKTGATRLEPRLPPGAQDRGSLHAALMLLGDDFSTERVILLDMEGPETHELRADGEETLDTPLGPVLARRLIQQRLGSSRRTRVWLAPGLRGLPVRIERQNDGETRAAFQLKSVRWHEPRP